MDTELAVLSLAALAQPTRLDAFRILVQAEPEGLPAGTIAGRLNVPHNTMSAHLASLSRAGLVAGERRARSIVYRAQLDRLRQLIMFLVKDCCGGQSALCAPLIASLLPCSPGDEVSRVS